LTDEDFFPHHRRTTHGRRAARCPRPNSSTTNLPVGKNWVSRFVNYQLELQIKWNRHFHSERARYEDPVKINVCFKIVEETRQAYGILDEDTLDWLFDGSRRNVKGCQ